MSENTLNYHWGKHHRAYCDNLNGQIAGTDLDGKTLEEIVLATWNGGKPTAAFNNAAQVSWGGWGGEKAAAGPAGRPACPVSCPTDRCPAPYVLTVRDDTLLARRDDRCSRRAPRAVGANISLYSPRPPSCPLSLHPPNLLPPHFLPQALPPLASLPPPPPPRYGITLSSGSR